jgi:hypothetical protein
MDTAVVVGNCQALSLEMLLRTNPAFRDRFELVSFPSVHEIGEAAVGDLHEAVASAALVIVQRVDEGYRDGIGLGTETIARIASGATVVRWPSVYWAGYVPDLFYLRDEAGQPVVDGQFDYHDRAILEAYVSGTSADDTCRMLADPQRPSAAEAWAANATAELGIRGAHCDVQVSSFIASHYRDELLFFTMNHPSNRLLAFMAQEIIELIGVPGRVDERLIAGEILGSTFYPLHANHVRALGLRFAGGVEAGRVPFRIRGETYDQAVAVQGFYDYYAANPRLAELNRSQTAAH